MWLTANHECCVVSVVAGGVVNVVAMAMHADEVGGLGALNGGVYLFSC